MLDPLPARFGAILMTGAEISDRSVAEGGIAVDP